MEAPGMGPWGRRPHIDLCAYEGVSYSECPTSQSIKMCKLWPWKYLGLQYILHPPAAAVHGAHLSRRPRSHAAAVQPRGDGTPAPGCGLPLAAASDTQSSRSSGRQPNPSRSGTGQNCQGKLDFCSGGSLIASVTAAPARVAHQGASRYEDGQCCHHYGYTHLPPPFSPQPPLFITSSKETMLAEHPRLAVQEGPLATS